jgi:hypothetical protein
MKSSEQMLQAEPLARAGGDALADLHRAAQECESACIVCADACLAEEEVASLRRCIRTDLDCADACWAAARILARRTEAVTEVLRGQVMGLEAASRVCAEECERHAGDHQHCRACAESCRRCERACLSALRAVAVMLPLAVVSHS